MVVRTQSLALPLPPCCWVSSIRRRQTVYSQGGDRVPLPPLRPGGRDVAIDVHRKRLAVLIVDAEGTTLLRERLPATAEGEAELLRHLRGEDRVALEATTGAHRLANRLEQTGATVIVADPQHNRLLGMRGKKSDWRDCQALLSHLR